MPDSAAVPASLVTPDVVKTSTGTFLFEDGSPIRETVEAVYGRLDRMHGVEAYLTGMPAVSLWAMRRALVGAGVGDGDVLVFSELMDCRALFLTANADTVYFFTHLDLTAGPVVVDMTSIGSFLLGAAPLAALGEPKTPRFVEGSGLAMNTIPPVDASFFTLLDETVQAEPASALDPEMVAPVAAVGIVKDRPFAPDAYCPPSSTRPGSPARSNRPPDPTASAPMSRGLCP